MPLTLASNIAALTAKRHLDTAQNGLEKSFERLSSGMRISRASDDAAGLAVATSLNTQARILSAGVRNLNAGISAINIATSALHELSSVTARQLELATQAANGSLSLAQRAALHTEANALVEEFNRIISGTSFNGNKLLNGSYSQMSLQAGMGSDGTILVDFISQFKRTIGTGTFDTLVDYTDGSPFGSVGSGDVNGDGHQDVVYGALVSGISYVLLGNGDGTFKAAISHAGSLGSDLFDVNGDGFLDILNPGTDLYISLGNGDGTFRATQTYQEIVATSDRVVSVADLNRDGSIDITYGSNIFLGNGDGTFKAAIDLGLSASFSFSSAIDVNGDGTPEIVVSDTTLQTISSYSVNLDGSLNLLSTQSVNDTYSEIITSDFNRDGYQDLIGAGYDGSSTVTVFYGNGDGSFRTPTTLAVSPFKYGYVSLSDFNNDGLTDISVANLNGENATILLGNADGSFQAPISMPNSSFDFSDATVSDFNNDGVQDIFFVGIDSGGNAGLSLGIASSTTSQEHLYLLSQSGALSALTTIQQTHARVLHELGALGASESRIGFARSHIAVAAENSRAAEGRIRDVDIAEETARLVRKQILQQTALSITAQANVQPQLILKLLQ